MRNRRIFLPTFKMTKLRQSFIMAGVILVMGAVVPARADALMLGGQEIKPQPIVNQVEQNEQKIKELNKVFSIKQSTLEEKAKAAEATKAEVQQVASAKEQLSQEVLSMASTVEQLKAQVAEKNRLEALRIVPTGSYSYDSAGNTYAPGNCTWYVKSRRADLPNGLGNANTWYSRASSFGFKTGSSAKAGAVGVSTRGSLGHVVYVEEYLGNGRILISEMNYSGLYSQRTIEANESDFSYIYERP